MRVYMGIYGFMATTMQQDVGSAAKPSTDQRRCPWAPSRPPEFAQVVALEAGASE